MKVVKLSNIHNGRESWIIQLPSGRVLGSAVYSSEDEAEHVKAKVLADAVELVAAFNADKAGAQ